MQNRIPFDTTTGECVLLSYSVHSLHNNIDNAWKMQHDTKTTKEWTELSVHTDPVHALLHNLLHFIVVKMHIALQSMRYEWDSHYSLSQTNSISMTHTHTISA